ncbi:putative metalloprotease CJM1_0395 family protein [Marinomonas sp. 2405UD68-3]|uniref:putative metalloprotease CJM1_0395 family protein n=1 Tax=Marinomonas sp. 2405UD68-3 TaxID=3391835 RepID=UPI0039C8DFBD
MSVSLSYLNNYPTQPSVDNEVISNKNTVSDKENQTLTTSSTVVTLSEEGKQLSERSNPEQNAANDSNLEGNDDEVVANATDEKELEEQEPAGKKETELTEEEQDHLDYLKDRDREVKIHEQAHASVGGQFAGSPSYTYEKGPDGQSYAVAGEVPIDVSPIAGDPQATISKMEQVYRAALAPVEPSSADRRIASDAQSKISEARAEIVQSQLKPSEEDEKTESESTKQEDTNSNSINDSVSTNDSRIASYNLSLNTLGGTISHAI